MSPDYTYPVETRHEAPFRTFHRRGVCRCPDHIPERFYGGFAACLRCGKLAPIRDIEPYHHSEGG